MIIGDILDPMRDHGHRSSSDAWRGACQGVAEILADEDLMNLGPLGVPDLTGEYLQEAEAIVRQTRHLSTLDSTVDRAARARVVSEVFADQFERVLTAEDANRVAERIEGVSDRATD